MNDTLRTLQMGRDRIARGWCLYNFAQSAAGLSCNPNSAVAVKWCARGAVGSSFLDGTINCPAEQALARALPSDYSTFGRQPTGNDVAAFNNSSNQVEVLALFDRAIEMERGKTVRQRTDSELVADLMQRIGKQTIPEGEIKSPEYVRA